MARAGQPTFLNVRFFMTESPEVIDTTQGLLRIDYVEIDNRINRHGNWVAGENLEVPETENLNFPAPK